LYADLRPRKHERESGLPIVDEDGVLVGAIGVSGSSVENDHKVCGSRRKGSGRERAARASLANLETSLNSIYSNRGVANNEQRQE
jgi:hypothetical protein